MNIHTGDLLAVLYANRVLIGKASLVFSEETPSRVLLQLIEPIEEFGKKLTMLSIDNSNSNSEILFKI